MTRIITSILALVFGVLSLISCSAQKQVVEKTDNNSITVHISKINSKGIIHFSLYNTEASFNQRTPLQNLSGEVKNNETIVNFTNLPKGTYAIICYQDTNANMKLDFDQNFMPTEAYGFSNNPTLYGPPTYEPLTFELNVEELNIEIVLQ